LDLLIELAVDTVKLMRHFVAALLMQIISLSPASATLSFISEELRSAPAPQPDAPLNPAEALRRQPDRGYFERRLNEIEDRLRFLKPEESDLKFELRADRAALLIRSNEKSQIQQAVTELMTLARQDANRYEVAANLSLAYERLGKLDEALQWAEKSLRLHPHPKSSTDWMWLLILQGKKNRLQADAENPPASILGADFGDGPRVIWPLVPDAASWAQRTKYALFYHIRERLLFEELPNPVIADLLFDYGNLHILMNAPGAAVELYEFAQTAGYTNSELLNKRLQHYRPQVSKPAWYARRPLFTISAAVIAVLTSILVMWYKLRHQKNR